MIATIWRFHVRSDALAAFEATYGPRGDWARLFARQDGYGGTELLRLQGDAPVYLTMSPRSMSMRTANSACSTRRSPAGR